MPDKGPISYPDMQNLEINLKGVYILLKGLKTFKATGPDSMPTRPTNGRRQNEVQVGPDQLEDGGGSFLLLPR